MALKSLVFCLKIDVVRLLREVKSPLCMALCNESPEAFEKVYFQFYSFLTIIHKHIHCRNHRLRCKG